MRCCQQRNKRILSKRVEAWIASHTLLLSKILKSMKVSGTTLSFPVESELMSTYLLCLCRYPTVVCTIQYSYDDVRD